MDASHEAWLLLRTFAALVVVVALAYVVLRFGLPWLMRQRVGTRARTLGVDEFLVLDRTHRLFVVRWEKSRLLVATSPERVDVLMTKPEAAPGEFEEILQREDHTKSVEEGGVRP